jgi:hypothetical protein
MQRKRISKYTNRYSHRTEKIIKLENGYQRRERISFDKNKENRQNAGATQEILY